jgi:hypothetical protein
MIFVDAQMSSIGVQPTQSSLGYLDDWCTCVYAVCVSVYTCKYISVCTHMYTNLKWEHLCSSLCDVTRW